jgi:hypothetical protein
MNRRPIHELALYRFRFLIAYALLAVTTIVFLVLNIHNLPAGLSMPEQTSAITSSSIDLSFQPETLGQDIITFLQTTDTINLPYHLSQKASLYFFGLSPLGVRLPSIVLAAASALMLFVLLRHWLRPHAAVLMSALAVTSSWFVSIGRLGTPDIMIIFWTVVILLLATLISQETRRYPAWKALSLIAIALSLYTPYTVYLFVAAALAAITQPHLRYLIRYTEKASLTIGTTLFLVLLVPLGYHAWRDPGVLWQLLAVSSNLPGPIEFVNQLLSSLSALLNPFINTFNALPRPIIAIPTAILALVGFIRLIADWHSVRSHVLLIWLAILTPLIGLGAPGNLAVLFIPVMTLCAIGLQWLIRYWYALFPLNPYARVFGMLPLGLLVFSLIQFNYQRYFVALPFAPTAVALYDQDPVVATTFISSKTNRDQRMLMIVPQDKIPLYQANQRIAKNLRVVSTKEFTSTNKATRIIVAEGEERALTAKQRALLPKGNTQLLVSDRKDNALRFRVYSAP